MVIKNNYNFSADPRPDLAEDSALWSIVIKIANGTNPQLAANLHGFRCEGTRLKRSRKWGLVMEPILPEAGPGKGAGTANAGPGIDAGLTGWRDREDYRAAAAEYLRPYHRELIELFKQIG